MSNTVRIPINIVDVYWWQWASKHQSTDWFKFQKDLEVVITVNTNMLGYYNVTSGCPKNLSMFLLKIS